MNSKGKRISSVLLALVLAISMLPITVFAAGPGTHRNGLDPALGSRVCCGESTNS